MDARSSNTKIWGWAVTQRRCLNGSTIPAQGPTPDAKLAAMGQNQLASSVHPCFIEASPTVEKAISCCKADWLIASLLSFLCIQLSLAVRKFRAGGKNAVNMATDGCVHEPLMPNVAAPKAHQNNRSYVSSADLPSDSLRKNLTWWAVTQRTLEKPQNCQNWGMGACMGMGTFPGQYGIWYTPRCEL